MATMQVIGGNLITPDDAVTLADGDALFVSTIGLAASTQAAGVRGTGSNLLAVIYGTATGSTYGIILGDNTAIDSGNSIEIERGGLVYGRSTAICFLGSNSSLTNDGTINAHQSAVVLGGQSALTSTTLSNTGLIKSGNFGIVRNSGAAELLKINNSGRIEAAVTAFSATAIDGRTELTNSGRIKGDVNFGVAGDLYDGTNGSTTGLVRGGSGADTLLGGKGAERFLGGSGEDILKSGAGNDLLTGGVDRDVLTGGTGADHFLFTLVTDSQPLSAGRDRILDFSQAQKDVIELVQIDAENSAGGNNAFHLIGKAAFSGHEGELRFRFSGTNTIIEADTNADSVADFAIQLSGKINLVAGDFLL